MEPLWLWEETHVLRVVGSNPSTEYWMDIFSHLIVTKIVWKDENKENWWKRLKMDLDYLTMTLADNSVGMDMMVQADMVTDRSARLSSDPGT